MASPAACSCSRRAGCCSAIGEGGGFPGGDARRGGMVSRQRSRDRDGHHQRRHRRRRRHRAAAHRARSSLNVALARHRPRGAGCFSSPARSACLWTLWWCAAISRRPASRLRLTSASIAPTERPTAPPNVPMARAAALPRNVGRGRREVPHRRGVVFLHVLAAEIPARCARLQHQGRRLRRMDSVRRRRAWAASWAADFRAGCCTAATR